MSVSGSPETEYIVDCVLAELNEIKTSNQSKSGEAFFTDIVHVELATFPWTDYQTIMQRPSPSAMVWALGIGPAERGNNFQERRQFLRLIVVGCVKQEDDVQRKALRLADDIDRTMLGNPMRKHPQQGSLGNNYGVMTAQTATSLPINFDVQMPLNKYNYSIFANQYDVTYRAPF